MNFDPTFLSNLLLILTGFGGAFIAALWIALVIWTYRDIRSRARDPLVQILSTLLVAVLCPGCERRVKDDWQVCPNCHTKLKKTCNECGKLMELPWNLCPYCGTPAPGMRHETAVSMEEALKELGISDEDGEVKVEE
jgi:RNA polymerase subunit RPABC4/transcription elongation factor Spt4